MKTLAGICAVFVLAPALVIANDDILTTAAGNGSFKTLVNLVIAADLDEALQSKGHLTVFAPTDEAFDQLPKATLESLLKPENREQLASILKYHVLPSEIAIARRPPSHPITSAKTLLGKKVQFERDGDDVKVNEANVVIRNIRCSNGLIQVIDSVLLPPQSDENSLLGVAKQAGNFKTLLAAIEAAELQDALAGDGPLTVFAPTDDAFDALPKGVLKDLLQPENKDQLATILKYHVVKGEVTARDALQAGRAKTLAKEKVSITIQDGRLRVNEANVISNDVKASNGIIHIIDQVLLPHSSADAANLNGGNSEITITSDWDSPVTRDGIEADRITIRCGGAGRVRLTNVVAKEIVTSIGGGGSVSIEGTAERHNVTVGGGATLRAKNLISKSTEIQVNGGGEAVVHATDTLVARANAGAELRYVKTDAKIKDSINKYAEFSPINASQAAVH